MRTCSAGLNTGPDVVQCESYVRAFARVPMVPVHVRGSGPNLGSGG